MTRNQKNAIAIMQMLKEGMNVNVEYYAESDRMEFWYNYDTSKGKVKNISIRKDMDDTIAQEKIDEIESIIKELKIITQQEFNKNVILKACNGLKIGNKSKRIIDNFADGLSIEQVADLEHLLSEVAYFARLDGRNSMIIAEKECAHNGK